MFTKNKKIPNISTYSPRPITYNDRELMGLGTIYNYYEIYFNNYICVKC